MKKGRASLGDFDFPGAPAAAELGEGSGLGGSGASEREELPDGTSGPPVEQAVVVLTGLEAALDLAEGSLQTDSFGSASVGRSKGAPYRLLKESLEKSPELIHQEVERLLDEDLSRRAIGSLSAAQSSARAWVEFRSRVGYYPTTIRTMWCLAGIFGCS